jgi:hypothetical protein
MKETKEADFTKPLDPMAFLTTEIGICGCSEYPETIAALKKLLEWFDKPAMERVRYDEIFGIKDAGLYYLLAGLFDNADLIEHGVSVRTSWLTPKGKAILLGLRQNGVDSIIKANGTAYDGLWYPGEDS